MNDGTDPAPCSLSYTWVEQVAQAVLELGPGTQLPKIDIKSVYRIIPDDQPLLGMIKKYYGKITSMLMQSYHLDDARLLCCLTQ